MRVISVNVNGLRSAGGKGFFEWLDRSGADIACLQETRILPHQIEASHQPHGWHCEFFPAERPGYAGTAIYSRQKPDSIARGLGFPLCDTEGRWIEAQFGPLTVASLYLPSGSASDEAQARKDVFLGEFLPRMRDWKAAGRSMIVCGDWNIAHKPIDLKNWRGNQKNSGFLPHERVWLDTLFGEVGFVDAHRGLLAPDQAEYTWWSNRGRAWDNNVGWRIDYQVVTPDLAPRLATASVYRDQRFSDHAPLIIDYRD